MRPLIKVPANQIEYDEEKGKKTNKWNNNLILNSILKVATEATWYYKIMSEITRSKEQVLFFPNGLPWEACETIDLFIKGYDTAKGQKVKTLFEKKTKPSVKEFEEAMEICSDLLHKLWVKIGENRKSTKDDKEREEARKVRVQIAKELGKKCVFFLRFFGGSGVKEDTTIIKEHGIIGKLGDYYDDARTDLFKSYHNTCSYCGIALTIHGAVEHMLPKAEFPALGLAWDNFLPACAACNSKKGSHPSRHDLYLNGKFLAKLKQISPDPLNTWPSPWTESNFTSETKKLFPWPNDDDYINPQDLFSFKLYEVTYEKNKRKDKKPVNEDIINKLISRQYTFDIDEEDYPSVKVILPPNQIYRVELLIEHKTGASSPDKVNRFIEYCNLNRNDTEANTNSDSRIRDRTLIWLKAITSAKEVKKLTKLPTEMQLRTMLPLWSNENFWAVQMHAYTRAYLLDWLEKNDKALVKKYFYQRLRGTKIPSSLN